MKKYRVPWLISVIAAVISVLSACALQQSSISASLPQQSLVPEIHTFSGSYLAGRFAQRSDDWRAAEVYLNNVLSYDADNASLLQRTFLITLGSGNYEQSRKLAASIVSNGENSEIALVFLAADSTIQKNYAAALDYVNRLPNDGFGQYTKPLLSAWALAGLGKIDEADSILAENAPAADAAYPLNAALIHDYLGDVNGAIPGYKAVMQSGLNLNTALVVTNFFERAHAPEMARVMYDGMGKFFSFNPFMSSMQSVGNPPPQAYVQSIADGMGLAIFDFAKLLYERHSYDSAKVYGRLAQMLTPHSPLVQLMMGDVASARSQYDEALQQYADIKKTSALFWLAQMRIAETYEMQGQSAKTINMLNMMAQDKAFRLNALITLGDIYRRHEDFSKAFKAYDQALSDIGTPTAEHWPIIYARGVSLERMNNWAQAEKDLLQALAFQPDNPNILNFIGYNWVTQGVHLEKALTFIQHALAQRPNDGYIMDSYGWAYYQLGQYDKAVTWLEKSLQESADDSTILDHLGDAYWQTGRYNEARFKWQRAYSLSGDIAFKSNLHKKIKHGIANSPNAIGRSQKEAKL